MAMSLF